ncbi:flavodoxin family protein [Aquipuribacter nitratireducens]|uniref:Flavodoxin family protein n=1 Tax=Aquipuribacter nitratireducens TaxID=650104 RepID=A0ABW0GKP4_9MICO
MRALVVYESMFGCTEQVALAVKDGLRDAGATVEAVEVSRAPSPGALREGAVDLLVVGAPTHALGLSRPETRADAAGRGRPLVSRGQGVREWLAAAEGCDVAAAAFDTHVRRPRVPGHAGRAADRRLRRLGCRRAARPESFDVEDVQGPLCDGEVERAHAWGVGLAASVDSLRPR